MNKEFITHKEVAKKLGVTSKDVILKIKSGEIPAVRFSRKIFLIETHNLENFINNKSVQVRTL